MQSVGCKAPVLHALLDLVLRSNRSGGSEQPPDRGKLAEVAPGRFAQQVAPAESHLPSRRPAGSSSAESRGGAVRADPPDGPVKPRVGSGGPRISATTTSNAIAARRCGLLPMLRSRRACIAANGRVESSVGMDGIWALPAMTSRPDDGTVSDARSQPRFEEDGHASSRSPPSRPRPERRRRGDAGSARGGTTRRARRARRDRNAETSASGSQPGEARPRMRVASVPHPETDAA